MEANYQGKSSAKELRMKFRKPHKVTNRTSSVTNAFVQAILPWEEPTELQKRETLRILGIDPNDISCCYCGKKATDWDHLNPLVSNKRPTGYISEFGNLVPSCSTCNQSKSGSPWERWMFGSAKGSPNTRGVQDLQTRAKRLKELEARANLKPLNLAQLAGPELWTAYWEQLEKLFESMDRAQALAETIKSRIHNELTRVGGTS